MIERLMAPGAFHQAPYCHAARAGSLLFLTGQMPADPATGEYVLGDIETETRRVMDNLVIVLETAGPNPEMHKTSSRNTVECIVSRL